MPRDEGAVGKAANTNGEVVAFLHKIDEPVIQNEVDADARIESCVDRGGSSARDATGMIFDRKKL